MLDCDPKGLSRHTLQLFAEASYWPMESPEKDSMKLSVGKWIGGNPQCERGQPLRAAVIGLVRKALLMVAAE
jgi:hypothetical protein